MMLPQRSCLSGCCPECRLTARPSGSPQGGCAIHARARRGTGLSGGGFFELFGALGHATLEVLVQPLELPGLEVQIDEYLDFRAKNLRHDRDRQVVDGAALISLQPIEIREVHARDEDNRRLAKPG